MSSVQPVPPDERIVTAAKSLILAHGYAVTSMDQIAHLAKVSKTTLYKYYRSKAELFAALVLGRTEVSRMEFKPEDLAGLEIDAALFEIGRRFVDLICSPDSLRVELVYHSEGMRFPEVAEAFRHAGPELVVTLVESYIRAANQRGLIAVPDPHFAAIQFLIALKGDPYGIASLRSIGPSKESQATYIRKVIELYLNGARPRG